MHHGERFNTLTHLLGLLLAVVGTVCLLGQPNVWQDADKLACMSVFCAAMVTLSRASSAFHGLRGQARLWWAKADHCAIFLMIAGTYTPFAVLSIGGLLGGALLAGVWGLAVLGIVRELRAHEDAAPSLALYLLMGWLGAASAATLLDRLSTPGALLLLLGGLLYTVGVVFYVKGERWRHAHGIWHLFVMGGSASHYLTVYHFVA